MSERRERVRRRAPRTSLALVGVLALAGLLFAVNSQVSREHESRYADGLAGLVAEETELVRQLTADAEALRTEVDDLTDRLDDEHVPDAVTVGSASAAGRTPVTGPGLTVTLDDAPADSPQPPGVHPDDLVVHQQDIEAVVNALWAGGAEAMAIQGQRIVTTSAIRCVGNVLLLHGQVYSPPYTISAIGEPEVLRAALDASPAVAVYREWAGAVGLGWSVQLPPRLDLPAHEGGTELRYARVPDGVDVFADVEPAALDPLAGGR